MNRPVGHDPSHLHVDLLHCGQSRQGRPVNDDLIDGNIQLEAGLGRAGAGVPRSASIIPTAIEEEIVIATLSSHLLLL